jgi:phosphatidylserine/phosphatidylglycerophosphate/cardiolipin synthase-like enzyme
LDVITLVSACTVGASVVGYILFKNRKQTDQTKKTIETIDLVSKDEQDTFNLDYAFTKTSKNPDQMLKDLIDQAKEKIDLAVYTFTDKGILQRIIQATKRGVRVRLMTDHRQSVNAIGQNNILEQLMYAGVPIKENCHNGFMHLKVAIVDSSVVSVGSYNFTKAAREKHDEILVVIKNKKLANEWTNHFDTMWNNTSNYRNVERIRIPNVS